MPALGCAALRPLPVMWLSSILSPSTIASACEACGAQAQNSFRPTPFACPQCGKVAMVESSQQQCLACGKTFEAFLETERTQTMSEDWRRMIGTAFSAKLEQWTSAGVFASKKASEAFYVNTDPKGENLNNPLIQKDEKFRAVVAIAVGEAGRFMEITFTKDDRAVESFIQQQMAATSVV